MSLRYGRVRYKRRAEGTIRRSEKLTVVMIIFAVIVLFTIVSVIIGIALGNRADKPVTKSRFDFSSEPYRSGEKTVKSVCAYAYSLGADAKGYVSKGVSDLSFCLWDAEGNLSYASGIMAKDEEMQSGRDLKEEMEYIHSLGGYACAYVYANSFKYEDEYLREIYKAYEIALIHEASSLGVDDVLIIGLDINYENIVEIEKYMSDAAIAADKSPLGVLVSAELLLLTEQDIYLASRISSVCDYLALDLRSMSPDADEIVEDGGEEICELEATLSRLEYYIEAYRMRVVLSKGNASLYDSARGLGVVNIQIVD